MRRTGAPLVIAHRGASGSLPENTLPACALAIEQGADMIEIDLHRTRDGAVVVIHDEAPAALGRAIADATLEEVLAVDLGGGARVPTLAGVLDAFGERIAFNLEIKCPARGAYPGLEAAVLAEVGARGLLARTLFSSFDDAVLERLKGHEPAARTALLVSRRTARRGVDRARRLGAEALNPQRGMVGASLVGRAHAAGLAVLAYVVDRPGDAGRLLALGVDGLFTNFPGRIRSWLDRSLPPGDAAGRASHGSEF